MVRNVVCECARCATKDPIFRQVSTDLARKHLKKHGPAPFFAAGGDRAPGIIGLVRTGAPTAANGILAQPGTVPTAPPVIHHDDPEPFDPGFDDVEANWDYNREPIEEQRVVLDNNAPAPPPDTLYRIVEITNDLCPYLDIDPKDAGAVLPPAIRDREPSHIRMAYLQAVINNVYRNMSVVDATENLNITLNALDVTGALPDYPRPVRTLISAKRRLGIDPDQWIVQYAICPKCWKHYAPKTLHELEEPGCLVPQCDGTIYTEKRDQKGCLKRYAVMVLPHVSIIQSLRRMLRRKGFRKLIRDSRNTPPNQNDDEEFLMQDMHDGQIWHDLRTGIKREVGNHGTVRDTPVEPGQERKLTDTRLGLHLVINLDWYAKFPFR